ncbi:hypothetical protein BDQ12DRAFT_688850 [Crucibulum laeve]|uniref:Uncharacterized protein n=1 Tax=Crucibulum laeve TaxID=68775 RepID=A0A5C3LQH5_9AGAR|nr:hypothetical protein BDQ12DRAFT_688850 [Crucibulum laeve]
MEEDATDLRSFSTIHPLLRSSTSDRIIIPAFNLQHQHPTTTLLHAFRLIRSKNYHNSVIIHFD